MSAIPDRATPRSIRGLSPTSSRIDPAQVKHRQGDSDFEIKGWPSVASRSTITAGTAVVRTVEAMVEKGKTLAAHVLEADEKDIAYRRGAVRGGRHRSLDRPVRSRRQGRRDEGEGRDRRKPRYQARCRHAADLPEWLPYCRSRDRAGDRRGRSGRLLRGRRLRHHARSHAGAWSGAWRHRAGARPGAAGARGLRQRQRAARDRLVHGLRDAARAPHAVAAARRFASGAGDHQSARREGRRRSRHHRFARRDHECDCGRGARRRRTWTCRRPWRRSGARVRGCGRHETS